MILYLPERMVSFCRVSEGEAKVLVSENPLFPSSSIAVII